MVERLAIWIAAGKPADNAALTDDTRTVAVNDTPDILAGLIDHYEDLPEAIGSKWQNRSIVEACVRSLIGEWTKLSPDGETQKKVTTLSEADIDLIHPEDDRKQTILASWMAKHSSAAERRKHSPHTEDGEAIETVRMLVPAGLPRSAKGTSSGVCVWPPRQRRPARSRSAIWAVKLLSDRVDLSRTPALSNRRLSCERKT